MTVFKRISPQDTKALIDTGDVTLVDIRDKISFNNGHIQGASHLDNSTVEAFIEATDSDKPLIVYCYHGNNSLSAAQFFSEKEFRDVYSMDGGFEMWRTLYPS
ncbi:MAG: thiosulfate sulfurtransferase GlpE [Pseudomonadales bacterium]